MLALSLMSLVFSGMVVMYPNTSWAMMVVPLFGGPELLNDLHHWAGVIFLLTIFGHAAVVLMRLLKDKEFDWFGPDSLLPRWRDWEDMKGQFRWYFGKGKQPRFDRWTYWEKFDYWAVYWGALVIGVSGILLWFAESIGQVLPGWIFNVATLAHGLEAFLAVMTLFVVHFFNNHFRPAKFPLDTVMFTGSWDLEELKEERPEEYERLKASGELEKHLVGAALHNLEPGLPPVRLHPARHPPDTADAGGQWLSYPEVCFEGVAQPHRFSAIFCAV